MLLVDELDLSTTDDDELLVAILDVDDEDLVTALDVELIATEEDDLVSTEDEEELLMLSSMSANTVRVSPVFRTKLSVASTCCVRSTVRSMTHLV